MVKERAYWLAWSQISGIGSILLQRLREHFGTLENAWKASKPELRAVEGCGFLTLEKILQQRSHIHPEQLLTQHQQENPHFWTPADTDYPHLLREIPTPPALLYYRGQVDLLENLGQKPLVGIVGTRQPTEYGLRWTRQISTTLAKNGFTIVSGMAAGIDTESHLATMKAGGRTLAILGTGVDVVYPHQNWQLYKEILTSGLVLSEYPAKTPPHRTNFPRRNRIIAGLSRAILVIEAPAKSGALITADYANEFGRDVYALPGRVDDLPSQGCLKLISQGASLILPQLGELLTMLGAIPKIESEPKLVVSKPQYNLSSELQQVIKVMSYDAISLDLIIQKTNLDAGLVSSALLQLELLGLVSQLPGMRYSRTQE